MIYSGIVVVILVIISSVILSITQGFGNNVCLETDEKVIQVAQAIQEFYSLTGRYPYLKNDSGPSALDAPLLKGLKDLYDIDAFDMQRAEDAFVYFQSNCKLRIFPDRYEVYPRR